MVFWVYVKNIISLNNLHIFKLKIKIKLKYKKLFFYILMNFFMFQKIIFFVEIELKVDHQNSFSTGFVIMQLFF